MVSREGLGNLGVGYPLDGEHLSMCRNIYQSLNLRQVVHSVSLCVKRIHTKDVLFTTSLWKYFDNRHHLCFLANALTCMWTDAGHTVGSQKIPTVAMYKYMHKIICILFALIVFSVQPAVPYMVKI